MTLVKLRSKPISGNRKSLYLDFYPPIQHPETGKLTRREFLGKHIFVKPKSPFDKDHNRDMLSFAENVRAKRQIEIQNGEFGFLSKEQQNANFITYFQQIAEKHQTSNRDIWMCALRYLKDFAGDNVRFSNLNKTFCNDFREYLLNASRLRSRKIKISQNSASNYFNKLRAALNQAHRDGLIKTNISSQVEKIKEAETERQFLTLEELNKLAKTECTLPILKQAALFAALTGLRFSDVQKLVWSELQHSKADGYFLRFTQKKTKGVEMHFISEQAAKLLGDRGKPDEQVFEGLQYSAFMNFHLKRWILAAGITKNITFHCFRHTYATLQHNGGTDLLTISKLLGHRNLKTTMIYTKLMDKAKREAAEKIKIEM